MKKEAQDDEDPPDGESIQEADDATNDEDDREGGVSGEQDDPFQAFDGEIIVVVLEDSVELHRTTTMDYDSEYTVIIRGKQFLLNKSQIEFDSPNFFTACFLGDFNEAKSRTLRLSRDPDLFQIVINYLCGYTILPLNDAFAPAFMTPATALTNLKADALFYQLNGLVEQCDTFLKTQTLGRLRPNRYLVVGSGYRHSKMADIEDQIQVATNSGGWKTWMDQDAFQLSTFQRPESRTDFDTLREVAAIDRFVASQVPEYCSDEWKLVGWSIQKQVESWDVSSQLMVVIERVQC
ncbi:hypothetical protein OPQ81_005010 [Rhizoctonia solani]|nr:hypothetical protein OPQ81_005010 [Rhizoctonia solani]